MPCTRWSPVESRGAHTATRATTTYVARIACAVLAVTLAGCDDTVAPGIEVVLSEPVVDFRAVRGTATIQSKSITVSNSGDGRLGPVSCPANPAAWLTCSVANGNSVTFTASSAGLTRSPATVSVPITAPGAPDRPAPVDVNLIIDQPVLTLSGSAVNFSASDGSTAPTPVSATITVTNTGAGTLASLGAISCVPTPANARVSCAVNQGSGVLSFTVNPTGLAAATYVFPVIVSAPNDDVSKTVTVTLAMSALPRISLSQGALVFQMLRGGAPPAAQAVTVSNGGGGSLGTVTCPASPATWLSCSVSGNATLTFAVDPTGLSASPVGISVPISATGATNSPQNVTVNFTIRQPVLSVDSTALAFAVVPGGTTTNPTSATVRVTNSGEGTFASLGTITCVPPDPSPVTCEINQNTGVLTFTVNPTGIVGTKLYTVTVSAPNSNVSRVITVSLAAATGIGLSPSELNFQAIRGSITDIVKKVKVSNIGSGLLGTISCTANPAAWLTCQVFNTDTLYVIAKPAGLTASPLPVQIEVRATGASNNPQILIASFDIQQPVLSLSESVLNMSVAAGGTAGPSQVIVNNSGAGNRGHLGTINCDPADDDRVACTVDQTNGILFLTVNTAAGTPLTPGKYVYTVAVSAPNMNNSTNPTVTIVLNVTP